MSFYDENPSGLSLYLGDSNSFVKDPCNISWSLIQALFDCQFHLPSFFVYLESLGEFIMRLVCFTKHWKV